MAAGPRKDRCPVADPEIEHVEKDRAVAELDAEPVQGHEEKSQVGQGRKQSADRHPDHQRDPSGLGEANPFGRQPAEDQSALQEAQGQKHAVTRTMDRLA